MSLGIEEINSLKQRSLSKGRREPKTGVYYKKVEILHTLINMIETARMLEFELDKSLINSVQISYIKKKVKLEELLNQTKNALICFGLLESKKWNLEDMYL